MLIVKDDVSLMDSEGEPRRSIADRRRKAPAARDVAGLIRSIDYSAMAALERALKSAPDEHGKIARALEGWRKHSVAAFLSAQNEGAPLDLYSWRGGVGMGGSVFATQNGGGPSTWGRSRFAPLLSVADE
jgi:maltose alpha-D-glucosyltransferase / alpha-amylase